MQTLDLPFSSMSFLRSPSCSFVPMTSQQPTLTFKPYQSVLDAVFGNGVFYVVPCVTDRVWIYHQNLDNYGTFKLVLHKNTTATVTFPEKHGTLAAGILQHPEFKDRFGTYQLVDPTHKECKVDLLRKTLTA